ASPVLGRACFLSGQRHGIATFPATRAHDTATRLGLGAQFLTAAGAAEVVKCHLFKGPAAIPEIPGHGQRCQRRQNNYHTDHDSLPRLRLAEFLPSMKPLSPLMGKSLLRSGLKDCERKSVEIPAKGPHLLKLDPCGNASGGIASDPG